MLVRACVREHMCVCLCVCVHRHKWGCDTRSSGCMSAHVLFVCERERDRERESVCVYVCRDSSMGLMLDDGCSSASMLCVCVCVCVCQRVGERVYVCTHQMCRAFCMEFRAVWIKYPYGVATISRLLKIIGLFLQNIFSFIGFFCKRDP